MEADIRLKSRDIRYAVHFMASLAAGEVKMSDLIHELHALLPLLHGQLHLTSEVMEMLKERCEDFSVARRNIWAHGVDDILGKVGIESV
jgi:hypothetical protein